MAPRHKIVIIIDGGIAEPLAATLDCDIIIIDKDAGAVGEDGYSEYEMKADTHEQVIDFVREQTGDDEDEE